MGRLLRVSGSLLALVVTGCAGGSDNLPPTLDPIPDQVAAVGTELTIALRAKDPDGDPVSLGYASDLGNIANRAQLVNGQGGTALFKWVPIGSDVGTHQFRFSATDGKDSTVRKVSIVVKSAAGGAGSPIFEKPLGTGSTLDLGAADCIDVPIEIQDSDSTDVTLGQEAPLVAGATLEQSSGLSGTWHWCPTPDQASSSDLFSLVLSADDHDNPKVLKDYLVVLQKQSKPNCPGAPPVVSHQPADQATTLDLGITAQVSDDKGLKYPPLLYFSSSDPGTKPDLGSMTQLTMTLVGGDMTNGQWSADIPNPVADAPQGASMKVYYLVVASDNDDASGDCDHVTRAPDSGAFAMTVTNSGTAGGLAPCKPCSSDVQCGGDGDNCIYVGSQTFCGQACSDDFDCPLTHVCSPSAVVSVGGKTEKQCVPSSGKCGGSTTQCVDDSYEENDVLSDVKSKPGLPPGSYDLKSCPGAVFDDEDWYPIDIAGDSKVSASLSGGSASNLDLMLTDSNGKVIVSSATPTSEESLSTCLTAGRYYFHVWAWSQAENPYTLSWSKSGGCTASCVDDSNEPDDNLSEALPVDIGSGAYESTAQMICSGNDDWYEVQMFSGETLHATLAFTQTKASEDLDLYLYDGAGTMLTPCSETDPLSCDSTNGASGDSNENLTWNVTKSDLYHVVVHGWAGSSNDYDICIDYTSSSKSTNGCPAL